MYSFIKKGVVEINKNKILKIINTITVVSYVSSMTPVYAVSNTSQEILIESNRDNDSKKDVEFMDESDLIGDEEYKDIDINNKIESVEEDLKEDIKEQIEDKNIEIDNENNQLENIQNIESSKDIEEENGGNDDIVIEDMTIVDSSVELDTITISEDASEELNNNEEISVSVEDSWLTREIARQVYGDEERFVDITEDDWLKVTVIRDYQVSGEINSIPKSIGKLKNLKILDLTYLEIDEIPVEIGELVNLEQLTMYSCGLNGSIPESICNLKSLKKLELSNNNLTGNIPSNIGNLGNLEDLFLQNNKLTGTIPDSIGLLYKSDEINLKNNSLSGQITPRIFDLKTLRVLDLGYNSLSGVIPQNIDSAVNLETLFLNDNNMEGVIPESICNLKKLWVLYIKNNNFNGELPVNIGNMTELSNLEISNNNFSGELPASIGNLKNINLLGLANNNFSGEIIPIINKLTTLNVINLENNKFVGDLSTLVNLPNLMDDYYGTASTNFTGNLFTGSVPAYILSKVKEVKFESNFIENINNQNRFVFEDEELREISLGDYLDIDDILNSINVLDINGNELDMVASNLELVCNDSGYFDSYFKSQKAGSTSISVKIKGTNFKSTSSIPVVIIDDSIIEDNWLNREVARQIFGNANRYKELTDAHFARIRSIFSNPNFDGTIPRSIKKLKNLQDFELSFDKVNEDSLERLGDLTS